MKELIDKKVFVSVGVLLTLGVLYSFLLWFKLTLNDRVSFETARQLYLSNYPSFLRNVRLLTALHIVLNMLAIICLLQNHQSLTKGKALLKLLVILNVVMMLWQMFSLM